MDINTIAPFHIAGIAVRTTNNGGRADIDIQNLWEKFFSENVPAKIPNRVSDAVYCVYTDYESDHTAPYTTILGCRVNSLAHVPEGLVGKCIEGGAYITYLAAGNLADQVVYNKWLEIWNTDLARSYGTDFEIYGDKAQNTAEAEVPIFVGCRP